MNDARTLTAFVRIQMKRYISHKYAGDGKMLAVYLLDPAVEALVAAYASEAPNDNWYRVLRAFGNKIRGGGTTTTQPAVLTTVGLRQAVRELIMHEFPRVPVLCYQELSTDLRIQPIARISLEECTSTTLAHIAIED